MPRISQLNYNLQYFFFSQSGIISCHLFLLLRVSEANEVPTSSYIYHLDDIKQLKTFEKIDKN